MHSIIKSILLGSIISVLSVLSYLYGPGYDIEENFGLGLLFTLRGNRLPPDDLVIIAIDKVASDYYKLPNTPSKWPRKLHVQLIDYLHSKQATVIAFDIFFKESKDDKIDLQFASAIKNANNIVLFSHLKRELLNQYGKTPRTESEELFNIERLIYPTPKIASAAKVLAPFALPKYPAKVSTFWLFRTTAGDAATIPVVTLQLYLFKQVEFEKSLNIIERDNNIHLPNYSQILHKKSNLNLNDFISEMKDWSAQNKVHLNNITQKIVTGYYDSVLTQQSKEMLLQFFNLYHGNNQRYLNFFGMPRTIKTYTYDAVLNSKLPVDFTFKNKVVFIGFSERLQPEQIDNFNTVFSLSNGVDLSGVEIAATAFSNLHNRNSIISLNYSSYLILIALFGFIIAGIARMTSSSVAILSVTTICVGYFALSYYVFNQYSLWLPVILPLFVIAPIALISSVGWQFLETNKERNRIRKAFGYYLPDNIVNDLATKKSSVQNSLNLMYGICMATDAEHYTTLSENLNPKELSVLVNNYYELLFKPVRHNQGIISDVVGDAMLAIWSAHNPELKLRQNACYAAIQIQQELHRQHDNHQDHALATRIGLHSGDIVIGNIGAVDHYEYRAVGDIVNTANRIQGLNKYLNTEIIASLDTIRDVQNITVRELGQFKLLGKSKILNLFEIIGIQEATTKKQRELISDFNNALNYFKNGELSLSLQKFQELSNSYPSDGPTQFYINYCIECLADDIYVKKKPFGIVCISQK